MKISATLLFAAAVAATPSKSSISSYGITTTEPPKLAQFVPTKYTTINNGTKIAYRRFGKASKVPLVYLSHFRQSMDIIDPLLMNYIAANREVILFDNVGVGHSEGIVPSSIEEMATATVNFLAAINVPKADILGFSMGGGVAQYIGMQYPDVVHKLILAGTQPSIGPGVVFPDTSILGAAAGNGSQPTEEDLLFLFFAPTDSSRAVGHVWWNRLFERQVKGETRSEFEGLDGTTAHLTAISAFGSNTTYFGRLKDIKANTLVTNGKADIMAPSINSFVLQQELPNAEVHLYPDSGHGHLFQFAETYAKNLKTFLE